MPCSSRLFQDVYRELVAPTEDFETTGVSGPQPSKLHLGDDTSPPAREDAFFLLLALLSDLITFQRSLGNASNLITPVSVSVPQSNPFALFSSQSEAGRIHGQIEQGLSRWHSTFADHASHDILALYCYCRLCLDCPALPQIQRAAQHHSSDECRYAVDSLPADVEISETAINSAWAVLDHAAALSLPYKKRLQGRGGELPSLGPAWMPVVVFHSAMLVWAKIVRRRNTTEGAQENISIRALVAFQVELEAMQWPCCAEMVAKIQDLMSAERR